jgi:protein phosphatase PTC7
MPLCAFAPAAARQRGRSRLGLLLLLPPPEQGHSPPPSCMHKAAGACCTATSFAAGAAYLLSSGSQPQPQKPKAPKRQGAPAPQPQAMKSSSGPSVLHGSAGWEKPSGPIPHAFASAWCLMPHPDKVHKGGEDAAFGTLNAIGVADGVGGWASRGVDPGLYSKGLMSSAARVAAANPAPETPTPTALLRAAFDDVESQRILGSTTAIVVTLESVAKSQAAIHVANLGDSGILLLRPPKGPARPTTQTLFRSVEQQHEFNFPFQLGGTGPGRDTPEMADATTHAVEENDLVILGSDGLFDNLFDEEIIAIVSAHVTDPTLGGAANLTEARLLRMAEAIAKATSVRAADPNHETPFAKGARKVRCC